MGSFGSPFLRGHFGQDPSSAGYKARLRLIGRLRLPALYKGRLRKAFTHTKKEGSLPTAGASPRVRALRLRAQRKITQSKSEKTRNIFSSSFFEIEKS